MDNYMMTQPYAEKMEEISTLFIGRGVGDPFSEEGYKQLISNESYRNEFVDMHMDLVEDSEDKNVLSAIVHRGIDKDRNPMSRSLEGIGATAGANGYNTIFAPLAPMTVIGYTGRAQAMDWFKVLNHNNPTFAHTYNLDYAMKGRDESTKKSLPKALRDGTLVDYMDAPKIYPAYVGSAEDETPGLLPLSVNMTTKVVSDDTESKNAPLAINGSGNLLEEGGFAKNDFSIDRNIAISGVVYFDATEGKNKYKSVFIDRDEMTGNLSDRLIKGNVSIVLSDDSVLNDSFMMTVNLSSGDYSVYGKGAAATESRILGVFPKAQVMNMVNQLTPMQFGTDKFNLTLDTVGQAKAAIPLTDDLIENFEQGEHGGNATGYATYFTNMMSDTIAKITDLRFEREVDEAWERDVDSFPLAAKLGGYHDDFEFDLTKRGSGGDNPFSWMQWGLKKSISHMLSKAHTRTEIEESTPKQWIFLGHMEDVEMIPEVSFRNDAGNNDTKNGFNLLGGYGYTDSFGRRVKIHGSRDERHMGQAIRGILKTDSMNQPTQVYFPWAFKVYQGRSPDTRDIDSIMTYTKDRIMTLSSVQMRITLLGNDKDLYSKIADSARGV